MTDHLRRSPTWIVSFLIEEWDEVREFEIVAGSEQEAIAEVERLHPWEATASASTQARPKDAAR